MLPLLAHLVSRLIFSPHSLHFLYCLASSFSHWKFSCPFISSFCDIDLNPFCILRVPSASAQAHPSCSTNPKVYIQFRVPHVWVGAKHCLESCVFLCLLMFLLRIECWPNSNVDSGMKRPQSSPKDRLNYQSWKKCRKSRKRLEEEAVHWIEWSPL